MSSVSNNKNFRKSRTDKSGSTMIFPDLSVSAPNHRPTGEATTPAPQSMVMGLLNLRGRIVTAIDLRQRLGLPPRSDGAAPVAVGIEERGELYGVIVDKVGDVLWLRRPDLRHQPRQSRPTLGARLRRRPSARSRADGRARRRQSARSYRVGSGCLGGARPDRKGEGKNA